MKIKYMGTAAAEGIPSLFCHCPICTYAREHGGKEKRTRSQTLINDDLLIDFPPDTYYHYLKYDFNLPDITNLLVTHFHTDHFYPLDLGMRCEPIAHPEPEQMTIYGNKTVHDAFDKYLPDVENLKNNFKFVEPEPFRVMNVGKYEVTALIALHDRAQQCLFYEINEAGKSILYAHDTGYFPQETWDYIEKNKRHYDLVSLDCTMMKIKDGTNHMGLQDTVEVKERLLKNGNADNKTIFVINHFSHNGLWTYKEMVEKAADYGMLVAFDGMEVNF